MVVRNKDDRTQIGVLEDEVLVEHYVSRETNVSMAGNIYLGRVQNVLPSMEAAFVDIGKGRNAVLYAGEVNWDAAGLSGNRAKRIENALSSGQTRPRPGHQGPDRPQGRPADLADLAAGPLPGLRAGRRHDRHLAQAARHRARPPQEDPARGRPRERRRHRAHRRRGRQRGGAARGRRPADRRVGGHQQARGRSASQTKGADPAARRARPHRPGDPRRLQRGLRAAGRRRGAGLGRGQRLRQLRGARPRRPASASGPARRTSSPTTGSTSRSPRRWTARSGCPRAARWSSTAPRP